MKIGDFNIMNSKCEKLLFINVNCKLTFNSHVSNLFKSARRKINMLARIKPYMSISKRRILMNAFFESQFNCCPLVSMRHSRINNKKMNRLYERCLRIM